MQDKEVGENEQDELAEEEPGAVDKVVKSLTVGKGKWKAVNTRAKVYREVDDPVSNLLKSLSICTNTHGHSATDASYGRPSRCASPHPTSGTARSARQTRVSAWRGKSQKVIEGNMVITSKRFRGQLVSQADESLSEDNIEVLEVPRGESHHFCFVYS
jgi:hypothetical protein